MENKRSLKRALSFFIVVGLVFPAFSEAVDTAEKDPQSLPAETVVLEKKTIQRFYDPVEIRARIMEDLLGAKLNELRVYSYTGGSFRPVPFQFDEWTDQGSMVLDRGGEANGDKGNGVLDREDMLVFMVRDAGDRVSRKAWPTGADKGIEIEIQDPVTGGKAWMVLLRFSETLPENGTPPLSRVDDVNQYVAQGDSYTVVGTNHVVGKKT